MSLAATRTVIREQVIKPQIRLNKQLSEANRTLEQANVFKSQFLANMSHELRTPLNSIIGYTNLPARSEIYGALNEKQVDRIQKIGQNGRRLLALINAVLDLSKIEAGRMELDLARSTWRMSFRRRCRMSRRRPPPGVFRFRSGCSRSAAGDGGPGPAPANLRDCALNAVKFTEKGEIVVSAALNRQDLILSVSDTGPGIPPAKQGNRSLTPSFHRKAASGTSAAAPASA